MKSIIRAFAITSLVCVSAFTPAGQAAEAKRKTSHMIAIGDSISAGFVAFTALKRDQPGLMSVEEEEEPPPPMMKYGFRYASVLESKSDWSWVTGDEHESIAARLSTYMNERQGPTKLKWMNMAESGALALHLPRQVRVAFENKEKADKDSPVALVTLMIGANDACQRVETSLEEAEQMKKSLRTTFSRLSAARPKTMNSAIPVFVSSIPMIPNLGRPEVLEHDAYLGMNCSEVRKDIINFCPTLVNWKTKSEYEARVARVMFVNKVLREAVASAKKEFPKLSLVFNDSFSTYDLRAPLLAADCFHPGRRGQSELARILWQGMPWFQAQTPVPAR